MEVRYQCNLNDYLEAQRAHASWITRYLFIILGLVFIMLGAFRVFLEGVPAGASSLGIGIFWLAWGLFFRPIWLRRDFRKNPNFARENTLLVKPDGLETTTEIAKNDTKWATYTKFKESPNLFLLYFSARIFRVVPKRAFSGPELEQFRELLRENLTSK